MTLIRWHTNLAAASSKAVDTRVPFPNLPSMIYANVNVLHANYNSLAGSVEVAVRERPELPSCLPLVKGI
jgi:hypothetical protein